MLRRAILISAAAALSLSVASAGTLVPQMEIPLAKHMTTVSDLSTDGAGNLYVLGGSGKGFSGADSKVYKFSPAGQLIGTFGEGRFTVPLRLTTTASGRVVVADFCRLHVFAPSGSLERTIELSACDHPIVALETAERETVAALTVSNDNGFHPQLHRVDVVSGNASPPVPDLVSMAGAPYDMIQKVLEATNRYPDLYLASFPSTGKLVAGYSRTNRLVAMGSSGTGDAISLAPFTPKPLPSSALAEEEYVQSVQLAAGRSYAKDQYEGFYNGLAADPAGRVVVTGRGRNQEGQYLSEVYDLSGRQVDTIRSPYELNRTLVLEEGKAYCICDRGANDWTLVRFSVR